jgi:2,3-bisphosphoglycerate-dependent phosphoglycerate mutase
MHKVVLLRHGESVWNKENLFTGWTDVDLSEKGRQEVSKAALILKKQGIDNTSQWTNCGAFSLHA